MSRRGTSSGGGASSLGYLFGSDATSLARPNNRAPPRPQPQVQPPADHMSSDGDNSMHPGCNNNYYNYNPQAGISRQQQFFEGEPTGCETPTGYNTPSADSSAAAENQWNNHYRGGAPLVQQSTRAAGRVINDGGGVSLDMSGGSNNYFRADGQNSGNFITGRPSTRVQAAPGGGSSLGYLFGGA